MKNFKISKNMKDNVITYGIVIAAYVIMQILVSTGHVSSLMQGLLVPLCVYVILAVSLNLTVGILGELSLGHAGFMCVGAFAGAFFSKCMKNVITFGLIRFVRDNFDMTILLIEHDMKLVSGICEELTVLNFGRILSQGKTSRVLNDPQVITAYLGE